MLWVSAIVLGLVFGLLTGGNLTNLAGLKFRWPWVIVAVIVVREAVLLTPLNAIAGAQYLYLVALAAIIAWTVWHFDRVRGIWLMALQLGIGWSLAYAVLAMLLGRGILSIVRRSLIVRERMTPEADTSKRTVETNRAIFWRRALFVGAIPAIYFVAMYYIFGLAPEDAIA